MPSYPSNFLNGVAPGTQSSNNITERTELRIGNQTTVASGAGLSSVAIATAAAISGLVYSNSAGTLTAGSAGTTTIDGVILTSNARVLIKNQGITGTGATVSNGIYTVTRAGGTGVTTVLTRSTDLNLNHEFYQNMRVTATSGTANSGLTFYLTTEEPVVLGTTDIVWAAAPTAVEIPSAANYPTDNTVGVADISNNTDTLGNFATALNALNAEISAYNTAYDALVALAATQEGYDRSYLANLNSGKINRLRISMLLDAYRIKKYTALMNLVSGNATIAGFGTSHAPTYSATQGSRYPSGWYRGWTA